MYIDLNSFFGNEHDEATEQITNYILICLISITIACYLVNYDLNYLEYKLGGLGEPYNQAARPDSDARRMRHIK